MVLAVFQEGGGPSYLINNAKVLQELGHQMLIATAKDPVQLRMNENPDFWFQRKRETVMLVIAENYLKGYSGM